MSPFRPGAEVLPLEETTHEAMAEAMLQPAGMRIADIGCGEGALARYLATAGAGVIGIDPDRERIDAARRAAEASANAAEFLTGTAEALGIPDGVLDAVIYSNSLHHVAVDKMRAALAEAARVLRPGGLLYVTEPLAEGAFFDVQRLVNDETEVRLRAYEELGRAGALGFEAVDERFYGTARRFDDYDDFVSRMSGRRAENARAFAENGPAIRARFEAQARREDGVFVLDMGFRANLLRQHSG
jgi:SAM-dependent methyltransferase